MYEKRDMQTRRIVTLTQEQIKPFQKILINVVKEKGTELAAYNALGISSTVFYALINDGYLTNRMAHIILKNRKSMLAKAKGAE